MKRAANVLQKAAQVTVVYDRESDIHDDFTQRPATVHLLLRAGFNRRTSGFRIEYANISDPEVMLKFLALAAIAAVTVTQLPRDRDNPSGQCLSHAFNSDDVPMLEAVCADYAGPTPTKRISQLSSLRHNGSPSMDDRQTRRMDRVLWTT